MFTFCLKADLTPGHRVYLVKYKGHFLFEIVFHALSIAKVQQK